jgi:RimJ/RimL family protein N-acetyltransferase
MTTLVVREYDEAIAFFIGTLGWTLVEDSPVPEQQKRWVVVAPRGSASRLLLARASSDEQRSRVGDQTGGRVGFFLETDNFWRDYRAYQSNGVEFVRLPRKEPHGTVAVFKDLYGNLWDLIQPRASSIVLERAGAADMVTFVAMEQDRDVRPFITPYDEDSTKRGRGIGQDAIAQMEHYVTEILGRSRVWLDVFEENERARHIYEKLGYSRFGDATRGDRRLLLYEKRLT